MISLEHARDRILTAIAPAQPERVPLAQAHGRILRTVIRAPTDLPPFDNSAMDGYAVRAADVQQATADRPVRLMIRDRIPAGEVARAPVGPGSCSRVFTGSPMPPGADAVVMQEDTRPDTAHPEAILVLDPVKPWESVRLKGEDIRRDACVASEGDQMGIGLIALFAALGLGEIQVGARPVVGLLATGNELCEPGGTLPPGKIYESNRLALSLLSSRAGGLPRVYPLVPDTLAETTAALTRALDECDLIITTGGVSVGELDFVKEAFTGLGGQLDFWRVAIKPGRPFVFGQWRDKCLFGLPGNPVSALVTYLMLVQPALLRWQGASNLDLPTQPAILADPLRNPGERRHFMRVKVDNLGEARPTGGQSSHMLHALALSNGLVEVPPNTEFPAGRTISVLRWGE